MHFSCESHDALNPWMQFGIRELLYLFYDVLHTFSNNTQHGSDFFRLLVCYLQNSFTPTCLSTDNIPARVDTQSNDSQDVLHSPHGRGVPQDSSEWAPNTRGAVE